MEDVVFERDSLQVRLDATDLQLLNARNSLRTGRERLEQHLGSLESSCLPLETLQSSRVSGFVNGVLAS